MQTSYNYVVRLCLNAEQGICIKYRRPLANLTEIGIRVTWLVSEICEAVACQANFIN